MTTQPAQSVQISRFFRKNLPILFAVKNKSDVIQMHHLRGEFYEEEELEDISLVIPAGALIFDVGSNVGNHLVYWLKFCRNARVVPFELNPEALELLRLNISLNKLESAVDASHLGQALGREPGFVELQGRANTTNNLGAVSFKVASANGPAAFPMTSLDALAPQASPDLVKIDVEGMEMEVLEGGQQLLERARPVLYVEVTARNRQSFKAFLTNLGYTIERTHQRHRGIVNYLCVPW